MQSTIDSPSDHVAQCTVTLDPQEVALATGKLPDQEIVFVVTIDLRKIGAAYEAAIRQGGPVEVGGPGFVVVVA